MLHGSPFSLYCICISKVTKFKANNNTLCAEMNEELHCICISKVTKFKANNNLTDKADTASYTVFA